MPDEALRRSLSGVVSSGRLLATDDTGPALTVQIRTIDGYGASPMLSMVGMHGFVSHPLPNADVVLLSFGGDRSQLFAVGHNDQFHRFRNTKPGECGIADDLGQYVMLFRDRVEVNANGHPVVVTGASEVTIRGKDGADTKVHVVGSIEATGEITAKVGASEVRLSDHLHSNAGGTGTSGPPVPGT